jgi:ribonuclease J
MTRDFIKNASREKPIAMITEGTRIDTGQTGESEKKVYDKSEEYLKDNNKISIVDFNFKDIDRFTTFYNISKLLDKKFVISFKHACFLERYHKDPKIKSPDSQDDNILILKPKRLTGTYCNEDYNDAYIKRRLNYSNIITTEELVKKISKYIIVLNFWYFNQLIDLKPKCGVYIHSLSEPFNEEMEISYDRMIRWIRFFNIDFVQSHCSGHINGNDLRTIIDIVKPKELFPIHTEKPKLFSKLNLKTHIVKEGKSYKI